MERLKLLLVAVALSGMSAQVFSQPTQETHWVSADAKVVRALRSGPQLFSALEERDGIVLLELSAEQLEQLGHAIHHELHRCGGFMAHESFEAARSELAAATTRSWASLGVFSSYQITQQNWLSEVLAQVSAPEIENTVRGLSSFHNRHYKAPTGVDSQNYIKAQWEELARGRSDVKVELFAHSKWPQPTVVLTIEGSVRPQEIVVLGGHADSIGGGFFGGGERSRAPGADDNASGIASLTEALRVALRNGFRPQRTVQLMAYAAEEAGLLGSKEIATQYRNQGRQVVGKLQLDMTLKKGTAERDIVLMSDYTNAAQNAFLGQLIDEYVKVPWGYSSCGYGCSDHAAWTAAGYPASIPFESDMRDRNKAIHTDRDTLETAGGNGSHAAKFAKLALAYMVELANQ